MSIHLTDNENRIEMPDAEEKVDKYGNPVDGDRLIYCCFPDCGCDGARLCMAENGANSCAEAPVEYQRTSVGLDVHALSVVACGIDGDDLGHGRFLHPTPGAGGRAMPEVRGRFH